MKKLFLLILVATLALFSAPVHADLLTNGDFSDGLAGWTKTGDVTVANGQVVLGGTNTSGRGELSQSFYITPGATSLDISFDLVFSGYDRNWLTDDTLKAVLSTVQIESHSVLWWTWEEEIWTDTTVYDWASSEGYTTVTVSETVALGEYANQNPNAAITFVLSEMFPGLFINTTVYLDNVVVAVTGSNPSNPSAAPVPEPATMLLLGAGLVGVAAISRKKLIKK